MSDAGGRGGRSMIPRRELPCVWMSAGVLAYRLCDRDLECGDCPLDRALRNAPDAAGPVPRRPGLRTTRAGPFLPDDVFLHRGDCWVRPRPEGELEVGLDDLARKALGPVRSIELPAEGSSLEADRAAAVLEGPFGRVAANAPFTGTLTRRNPALATFPETLEGDGYGEGWIFRGVPAKAPRTFAVLLTGDPAIAFLEAEEDRLLDLLEVAAAEESVGAPPEGGRLRDHVLAELEPARARRVLKLLLRGPRRR